MRNDHPIQSPVPLALIAVRIKASDQLNGVIDDLSCIATSVLPNWTGSTWKAEATRNPAAIYRHMLQGPHLKRRIPAARIDLPGLQHWHDACRTHGRRCDAVIQGQRSLFEALRDVAATGRAAFLMKDGLYSVKRDVEQTVPVQMITPRNIIGMHAERIFPEPPDALRVQFVSSAAGYQQDELIVYADGRNAGNSQTFDNLDLWGVSDADQAFRDARYHMAVVALRPERLTVQMDLEHLVARPGDLVRVAHDVMLIGIAQGRIVARTLDGAGRCTAVTVDEDCTMQNGDYRLIVRRPSAGTPELSRLVDTVAGINRTLKFRTPAEPGELPQVDDVWAFGETGRVVEDWIVNNIEPDEDLRGSLTLVPHAPAVHRAEDGPIPEYRPRITIPIWQHRPSPPVIVQVQTGDAVLERLPNGDLVPRIVATIRPREGFREPPIQRLEAQVRRAGGRYWDDDDVATEGMSRVVVRSVRVRTAL